MKLRDQIITAFSGIPEPGAGNSGSKGDRQKKKILDYFRGKPQFEHDAGELSKRSAALSCFSGEAYRYWLPAFMLAELDDPEEAEMLAEQIAENFVERNGQLLNAEQLEAAALFFKECARRYPAASYQHLFNWAASIAEQRKVREEDLEEEREKT